MYWYNNKYDRSGHLFQDRFRSENVESPRYFLTVLRYIHQNPIKAGIVSDVLACKWTSIHEYFGHPHIVDKDLALQLFSNYIQMKNDDHCLEDLEKMRISDEEVRKYLEELGIANISKMQQMWEVEWNHFKSKKIEGTLISQLARVTSISRSVISRIK